MHKSRRTVRVLQVGGMLLGAVTVAWLAVPALAAPAHNASASPPAAAQQTQVQATDQNPTSSSGSVSPDATTNNNGNGVCTNNPSDNPSGYPVCKKCPPGWSGPDQNGNCTNPCPPGYRPTGGHKNPPDCRPPKNPNQYCQAQYGNGWHFDKKSGDCVQDHKNSAGGPPPGTCYNGKVPYSGRCVPPSKACQLGYPNSHGAHYVKADKKHPTAGCYAGKNYLGPLPSGPPSP